MIDKMRRFYSAIHHQSIRFYLNIQTVCLENPQNYFHIYALNSEWSMANQVDKLQIDNVKDVYWLNILNAAQQILEAGLQKAVYFLNFISNFFLSDMIFLSLKSNFQRIPQIMAAFFLNTQLLQMYLIYHQPP